MSNPYPLDMDTPIPHLTWVSMPYGGSGTHPVDGLTGPDIRHTCETPRCATTAIAPAAEHIEMLWDSTNPGMPTVARAWKTCDACHKTMRASHQNGA